MVTLILNMRDDALPLGRLIPSIVTMLSLCAGLTAIKFAILGRFETSIIMILIAAFFDGIDGRIARALKSDSEFGAELDSLCDFVNFGISPGMILYFWGFREIQFFGWGSILLLAICMATRLARFNTMINDAEYNPELKKRFFLGTPAPIGGILCLLPIMIDMEIPTRIEHNSTYNFVLMIYHFAICYLTISRIPTISAKSIKINKRNAVLFIIGTGIIIASIMQELLRTMIFLSILYLSTIPIGVWHYRNISNGQPHAK